VPLVFQRVAGGYFQLQGADAYYHWETNLSLCGLRPG
jgi:hypothetical protein